MWYLIVSIPDLCNLTYFDWSLSFRYTAKLKAFENDPYSPTGKRGHINKQPQLNRIAPNRRRGLPNHRGRRGRRPTHQTYNRRPADNGQHSQSTDNSSFSDKNVQNFFNAFSAFNNLLKNQNNNANVNNTYEPYIDDIFLIWTGTISELKRFHQHCNSFHKTIKFTIEFSEKQVSFLDTLVIRSDDGRIIFYLFSKPTDKHCFLHFTSNHPYRLKISGPYSQFLRLKHICT